ncbi:transglycosylase SLT domain-containing protein [Endozoicomonas sp. SM1973]|uniref:Transglycosylase SLT domain-containing protein n=2 Tax=Spartinivicinus marinus TaxID=2994442 RepID=A0A853ID26_9GAMM|nr:transglycosylase SLT domain-containing protein [Spartinivicinus marinus]MCX4030188.1 transglycosylase SLT domain-containing protein [Spartinivicinus marinus]NYZ67831.1 transglycosylase SLT domain-containing protein [Spartinivicinus marinus]
MATPCHAEDIPGAYLQVAKKVGVPASVLYAIANQESRWKVPVKHVNVSRPWPWTLNVRGESRRFHTRQAAYQNLLNELKNDPNCSCDVGIMQVNWRWHKYRFRSAWDALDPMKNLVAGATYLKEMHDTTGDWQQAVKKYHSPGKTPKQLKNAAIYLKGFKQQWKKLY